MTASPGVKPRAEDPQLEGRLQVSWRKRTGGSTLPQRRSAVRSSSGREAGLASGPQKASASGTNGATKSASGRTTVSSRLRRPLATPVFDSYWRLAAERQRLFRARLTGGPGVASPDPVVSVFRFTNAYRASDRVSQYLIRHVLYDTRRPFRDVFARALLFKIFNRIETWELLTSTLGDVTAETMLQDRAVEVLTEARARGDCIYSAAYIMPSPSQFGSRIKHVNHLRLLAAMLRDDVDARLADAGSMANAFGVLCSYPSIGPFLGYQLVTDLNYSDHLAFSEDEFVVPGPGALDGLRKCFADPGDFSAPDIIRWVMDNQGEQFSARGITFDDLWGRPLQLIDCQNLFCEVDKYARVAHPQFSAPGGRVRIKQRFRPRTTPLTAWYPPGWGINDAVKAWLAGVGR